MNSKACHGKTAAGKPCKKTATNGQFCHIHCQQGSNKTPMETRHQASSKTPAKKTPVKSRKNTRAKTLSPNLADISTDVGSERVNEAIISLEAEWRSDRKSPGMGSLDWSPGKAHQYTRPEKMKMMMQVYPERADQFIPFPVAFQLVADKLMQICKTIPFGGCMIHPTMPGIQWNNFDNDTYLISGKEWKTEMRLKGNHWFHGVKDNDNNHYPVYDQWYCYCCETSESGRDNNAAETLMLPLVGEDERWNELHGYVDINDKRRERSVSLQLRKKILADTLEYLGQEYKIHLQPKPEYQLPVVRILASLVATDKVFAAHIEVWKTIVPYHRVTTDLNLPVVVIYPVRGARSATIILKKIIQVFSKYDCAKIGLNHTPRFNYRVPGAVAGLVYYAGGAGDQKKNLPAKFFTPGKEFYIDQKQLV